ncbi:hypothetical protein NE619_05345 [Anaerovorax odorimutans]|uniref:Fibronectin type-III domain-containing protein n=1 Tax=Anaerovorax odorimutans TaxID=109327 RepID=A0ABT1RLT1_9FIRM|nr:hypothetical protein [Anaerovorax odorimutans]MCQ4636144.1 hypothetical protein [Anaerovorax odorimutans]
MNTSIARKATAVIVALAMVMTMGIFTAAPVSAASSSAPKIEKIKYDGKGKVEVDFYGKVKYKKVKVTVKDTSGKKYKASIRDKDNDELEFKIKNYKKGKKYKFTIKGIKKARASKYTSVKGTVKIPAAKSSKAKIKVKDIDYDYEDQEVSFDFKTKVQWKNPKVKITDSNGNSYSTIITDRDNDDLEVYVSGLTYGNKYNYSISGIKARGASSYTTISGSFYAIDD